MGYSKGERILIMGRLKQKNVCGVGGGGGGKDDCVIWRRDNNNGQISNDGYQILEKNIGKWRYSKN